MFDLSKLPKLVRIKKKRVGRGKRGARGAKSGRGTKGALKRGKLPLYFEGGALVLTKRLPMLRGKGKNKPIRQRPCIVNVSQLNQFRSGTEITIEKLCQSGLVDYKLALQHGVKILGKGKLHKKLRIKNIPVSRNAADKIQQLGGTIVTNE